MSRVGIVYFSGSGTTRALTAEVEAGVKAAGTPCVVHEIVGGDIDAGRWRNDAVVESLDACDAIIFGTPTYMGGVSAQLKAFFDGVVSRWYSEAWMDKYAAGFTVSAKPSGDKLSCLSGIHVFAMQMGMLWIGTGSGVGLPKEPGEVVLSPGGFYLGVGATAGRPEDLSDNDKATARHLGERVGRIA